MSIFSIRNLALFAGLAAAAAGNSLPAATDYVRVSFTEREILVPENGATAVAVQLSRSSNLEVVVPFSISDASTAVRSTGSDDEAEGDADYMISDRDTGAVRWDSASGTGTMTFAPGDRRLELSVTIVSDNVPEDDKTIIFRIDKDNVTVARPVEPSELTLLIQDDDTIGVFLERTHYSVDEGRTFEVGLVLSNPSPEDIVVHYEIEAVSADEADLDEEFEGFPSGSLTIEAGARQGTIEIGTAADLDVEDPIEEFILTLNSASTTGSGGGALRVDDRPVTLAILDNDPTEVYIDLSDDERNRRTPEYGQFAIAVRLSAPIDRDVRIPLTFGGSATRGDISENDEADYEIGFPAGNDENPPEDILLISAGNLSASFLVSINNDTREEGDEVIEISLGEPEVEGGGTIERRERASSNITIIDNDPVKLSFGKQNLNYDPNDPGSGNPYIPVAGFVVGEPDGIVSIPVILSSAHGERTTFEIEVVSEGTTATIFDPDSDAGLNQDWDFRLQAGNVPLDTNIAGAIGPGESRVMINIVLNNDRQSRPQYGQSRGQVDDWEADETVRLRLTGVTNSDNSGVTLGEEREFTLTIRDFPEFDVTDAFAESDFRRGEAVYNPTTGLHEVQFSFTPPADLFDAAQLAGYRSYKVAFRPGRFDAEDPEGGDPLVPSIPADQAGTGPTYYRIVDAPFEPRYPTGVREDTLLEGEPFETNHTFSDRHADVRIQEYYFLQQLNLDVLDPERTEERTDYAEIGDPFDFTVEFSNEGFRDFDYSRLTQEGGLRIYLSRADVPPVNTNNTTVIAESNIMRFLPREDGAIFAEVNNPRRAPITVEYMDEDGSWRRAQPSVLRSLGSRLYWIDHGPPRTNKHPGEVDFRLYRFSTSAN